MTTLCPDGGNLSFQKVKKKAQIFWCSVADQIVLR